MKNIIAITGHCNTPEKTNHLLFLLNIIKQNFPDYFYIYSSHFPINEQIQKSFNTCIYDNENPIQNYDIITETTRKYVYPFYNFPISGYNLYKLIPSHSYAHFLLYKNIAKSLTDNQDIKNIHFICFDFNYQKYDICSIINEHDELLEKYSGTFYKFVHNDIYLNSEFFSITKKLLDEFVDIKSYHDYDNFGHFNLEYVISKIFEKYNLFKKDVILEIGVNSFDSDSVDDISYLNPEVGTFCMTPYYDLNKNLKLLLQSRKTQIYQILSDSLNYTSVIPENVWEVFSLSCKEKIKIFADGKLMRYFDLNDDRNIGFLKQR